MTKVLAGITTSVDYVAEPNDGPGKGLESAASASTTGCSVARELWQEPRGEPDGRGRGVACPRRSRASAPSSAAAGRTGAARHWGDENPWASRSSSSRTVPRSSRRADAFHFVAGVPKAVELAREAAGDKDVHVMGGASVIGRPSRRSWTS